MHSPGGLNSPRLKNYIWEVIKMIDENMIIIDILRKYPASQQVFAKYGMRCMGWHGVAYETVGQAAHGHGIALDQLMTDLNKLEENS